MNEVKRVSDREINRSNLRYTRLGHNKPELISLRIDQPRVGCG